MSSGTVKWFDSKKGWGFITVDGGSQEAFVHHTQILMDGFKELKEGDRVGFEVSNSPKGLQATNVRLG